MADCRIWRTSDRHGHQRPCPGAFEKPEGDYPVLDGDWFDLNVNPDGSWRWEIPENFHAWFYTIATLEDLFKLVESVSRKIIVQPLAKDTDINNNPLEGYAIEIYDDYRE